MEAAGASAGGSLLGNRGGPCRDSLVPNIGANGPRRPVRRRISSRTQTPARRCSRSRRITSSSPSRPSACDWPAPLNPAIDRRLPEADERRPPLEPRERRFLAACRVAHLATADASGAPHVVPVCFVLAGATLYVTIDAKPKR